MKKELLPCDALFCCIRSLYCAFPECIGCQGEHQCLCIECSHQRCKPMVGQKIAVISADATDDDIICTCCASGCYLVRVTTCCKRVEQVFCLEERCSIPCDDEFPCMLACCCIVFYYKGICQFSCCQTIGQIDPEMAPNVQNQGYITSFRDIYSTRNASVTNPLSPTPQIEITGSISEPVDQKNTVIKYLPDETEK